MANPSKAKGTAAESAVVDLAKRLDIPAVRPSLSGAHDKGDVWLWPQDSGARVAVEVKNRPTEFSHFPSWPLIQQWWAETEREAVNTPNCDLSILAVKPIGVGYSRTGDWWGWASTVDLAAWGGVEYLGSPLRTFLPTTPAMFPLGSLLSWLAEAKQPAVVAGGATVSGDDLPEFVGRVLRAANTPPPAKITIGSSAATGERTATEERARIVALLRQWADDVVTAPIWVGQKQVDTYGRALALRHAADRIEADGAS